MKKYLKKFPGITQIKMKGFSLMEMLIAVAIFSAIMITVSLVFSRSFAAYRDVKAVQRNLEGAQQAMSLMSKVLRSSEVVWLSGDQKEIRIFDYSQDKCVGYRFANDNKLYVAYQGFSDGELEQRVENCENTPLAVLNEMLSGPLEGKFQVVATDMSVDPKVVGKVIMSVKVCHPDGCNNLAKEYDHAKVQSTVSLRNFDATAVVPPPPPPPPVCVPNGCNANCPANCTVADDPDCGCQNGNGCCGIGCNAANDNDCVAPPPPPPPPVCTSPGNKSYCNGHPDCNCQTGSATSCAAYCAAWNCNGNLVSRQCVNASIACGGVGAWPCAVGSPSYTMTTCNCF